MSTFAVKVCKIEEVKTHPNADRLDLVRVKDWWCVTSKGSFSQGDLCVYFPIDSILPSNVESAIFGVDSKIKLNNSRVRTIKLRGAISQGLVVKPELFYNILGETSEGWDVTKHLKVTKFEPPVRLGAGSNPQAATKKQTNPNFRKYTGIENAKNYPNLFTETDEVSVTEKIHGTNFRAGYVPFHANSLWKKFKVWLGIAPSHEFVFGSHNVQLQSKLMYKGYYKENVYASAVMQYQLRETLKPGQVVYGEIYGDGIQKGYTYGCRPGLRKAVFFDVMVDGQWMDTIAFRKWATERDLPVVPELYRGLFNKEKILQLRDGDSVLEPTQKVREGVIVKPLKEETTYAGRKILKFVSDQYLLKNQDDESEAH